MALVIDNLSFAYRQEHPVLTNISLHVKTGEILGILGTNGTGKTTFIKCINKILKPDQGTIKFNDQDLITMRQDNIARLIAYVPQYNTGFFPMSAIDAVMQGRLPYATKSYSAKDKAIVFELLRHMNLEKFAFRNINELSGGERQSVFIARAMAQQPQIIILDEPTSSLDLHNQLFILNIITELARKNNITVIMTIHDLNLAAMFCDKLLMLKNTKVFAYGSPEEVLTEENIRVTYDVNTIVTLEYGYKHIHLMKN